MRSEHQCARSICHCDLSQAEESGISADRFTWEEAVMTFLNWSISAWAASTRMLLRLASVSCWCSASASRSCRSASSSCSLTPAARMTCAKDVRASAQQAFLSAARATAQGSSPINSGAGVTQCRELLGCVEGSQSTCLRALTVSCSCCFSRVVMLMSCERSSRSYQRSFLAVSICTYSPVSCLHKTNLSSSVAGGCADE